MGNLEKLGILVIVILVVVVGVVAITPSETLFPTDDTARLVDEGDELRTLDPGPDLEPWPFPDPQVDPAPPVDLPVDPPLDPPVDVQPPAPAPQPVPAPAPEPAPAPTNDTYTYVVQNGDSLFKIGADLLGDGNLWREIAKVNPGLDPSRIRGGQEIQIPAGARRERAAPRREETPSTGDGGALYTVERGDTLAGIARDRVPSRSWRDLLAANSDVLSSPDQLRPGMKLRIPGGAAGTRSRPAAHGPGADGRVYVVESGDTLGAIARRELGSEGAWRRLLEHNSDVLTDPRRLRPGMRLRIPE